MPRIVFGDLDVLRRGEMMWIQRTGPENGVFFCWFVLGGKGIWLVVSCFFSLIFLILLENFVQFDLCIFLKWVLQPPIR